VVNSRTWIWTDAVTAGTASSPVRLAQSGKLPRRGKATMRAVDPGTGKQVHSTDRIQALQDQIADLKKRWPAHSTPPAMMQTLDALEEELECERAIARDSKGE
jgi:hypothetical protein